MGSKSTSIEVEIDIELDDETKRGLVKVAKLANKSPRSILRKAVREFIEDYYDLMVVRERLKKPSRSVSLEAVLRRNGLAR